MNLLDCQLTMQVVYQRRLRLHIRPRRWYLRRNVIALCHWCTGRSRGDTRLRRVVIVIYLNYRGRLICLLLGLLPSLLLLRHRLRCTLCYSARLKLIGRWRRCHIRRYHVPIILVHRIILVAIAVDVDLVQLMVNLWLEVLLHHLAPVFCRQLLR